MSDKSLTLKDYLEAATESSKRTRTVTIILVVASVLIFVGFLNSSDIGWMQQRLERLGDQNSDYAKRRSSYNQQDKLHENLVRSTVENAYVVRVPFFGVAFDVNDLGPLGGLGLISILVLLRLSLRNQIITLRVGFKAALNSSEAQDFYDVLAAKQVFVFPALKDEKQDIEYAKGKVERLWEDIKAKIQSEIEDESPRMSGWSANRNRILWIVPKMISLVPFLFYSFIVVQDFTSRNVGYEINATRTLILLFLNSLFLLMLFLLGVWCISKWNEIDRLWDYYAICVEKKNEI